LCSVLVLFSELDLPGWRKQTLHALDQAWAMSPRPLEDPGWGKRCRSCSGTSKRGSSPAGSRGPESGQRSAAAKSCRRGHHQDCGERKLTS